MLAKIDARPLHILCGNFLVPSGILSWNEKGNKKMDSWHYWQIILHYARIHSILAIWEEELNKVMILSFISALLPLEYSLHSKYWSFLKSAVVHTASGYSDAGSFVSRTRDVKEAFLWPAQCWSPEWMSRITGCCACPEHWASRDGVPCVF